MSLIWISLHTVLLIGGKVAVILVPSTRSLTRHKRTVPVEISETKVGRGERLLAGELDLELGRGVGVGAGAHDRVAAGDVVAELGRAGERRLADPAEGLVAGDGAVGVDAGEVDHVLAGHEVGDHVAAARRPGSRPRR